MTSGGSRRRECPASAKKPTRSPTGAVCRSCTTMPVSTGASPTRRERRYAFPGSQVFGTGTLPVGFQGRSALVAEGEIPGASWLLTGDKIAGFHGLVFIPV